MIEGVEQFRAKFQIHSFSQVENFSGRQIRRLLSRSFKNVLVRVAEASLRAIRDRKIIYVEPQIGRGIGQVATADLIRALQSGRAGIAGIESDLW